MVYEGLNPDDPGASDRLHRGLRECERDTARALESHAPGEAVDAFLEQLIVRRELALNFCHFSDAHASLDDLPEWARATLEAHRDDPREPTYSADELERAATHDEVWNAAQRELVATGHFHGYLRMVWGKQIIRWTESYEEAQRIMLALHRRYALDRRDPNTYANVLWSFGLHDRAFRESPVLGQLRPLSSDATRRKFDLQPYFRRVAGWTAERQMPVLAADHGDDGDVKP